MKFKSEDKNFDLSYSPKVDDIKQIKKFAFLPTRIDKNIVVWLESYYDIHQYIHRKGSFYWKLMRRKKIKK